MSLTAPAWAEPRLDLSWEAPPECPTREDILRRAQSLLSPAPPANPDEVVRASGRIRQDAVGFELELETSGHNATGTRHLRAASCADLGPPAALLLALAVDPTAREPDPTPIPEGEPSPAPTPTPAPPAPVPAPAIVEPSIEPPPAEPRRSALGFRLAVGPVAVVGVVPGLAPGATAGLAFEVDATRLEARGAWLPAQRASLGQRGGDISLVVGGVVACHRVLGTALSLAPCLGGEVGRLRGRGVGVALPSAGAAWWLAGSGGIRVSQRLDPHFGLWASVELLVPLGRPEFILEGIGSVHRASAVGGRGALGGEVRFP